VSGSIDVTVVPDGVDTYLATGGGGSVTGTDGDYSFTFASDPGVSDNVISLDDSPAVDIKGLAFAGPDSSTPDLRYYSDGVGGLEWQTPSADVAVTDIAAIVVPLPASAGVGFGMLGSFGAMALLRKRLSRKSRIA
jgi:DNA-binding beta-propeller fold protein YncE